MITIKSVETAIGNADKMISDLKPENFDVPALTSLKIRHLLNNLGKLGSNYLECGVHRGGTFTSTVSYNNNLKHITAVDNFKSDFGEGAKAYPDFKINAGKFIPKNSSFKLIIADCFDVDLSDIPDGVDLYLYDGGHSEQDQYDAIGYYLPVLADKFIFLCDDFDWEEVESGTRKAISDLGIKIVFEKHLRSEKSREVGGHDNDSWWNGFYVSVLKKK